MLYLQGISTAEAMRLFPKMAGADAPVPSAKTVTHLFRRIGRYIFHKGFEPFLWSINRKVPKMHLEKGEQAYQDHLDEAAQRIIQHAKDTISLEQFHALAGSEHVDKLSDRVALEIRALLVARKGVSDIRADVGLAFLRALTPGGLPRAKAQSDHILQMSENALQHMLNDPMDEHGNTGSYLNHDPAQTNHNNNGAFDKKYWVTHGVSVADWKGRHQEPKERRLGYICTFIGEDSLEEQRDALGREDCTKIFEDINISPDANVRPGLNGLLYELRKTDTIVVFSLDRFGAYDERWGKIVRKIWKRKTKLNALH